MPFVPTIGAEPIAGYQLVEKLGTGGYGTVWKVIAPGGLTKALKIVFGDMSGHQAEQELKALGRIKEVRHPFLLSLERFEVMDGQLFIVTELADNSLLDRFNDCQEKGLIGIPREELLTYLRDAAEALDYMSDSHGLQHLDIKPQNLLLVGGRLKVADFGLVKELVNTSVTATGGVTPIYATPEAFDGRVSRFSDQYSLAVVYQEMLTGVRPFPGTTVLQLAAQHMSGRPLLDPLPPSDRPAISRALSKIPEKRFPTCREMVESLLKGKVNHAIPPIAKGETPIRSAPNKMPVSDDLTRPTGAKVQEQIRPTHAKFDMAELHHSAALSPSPKTKKLQGPKPSFPATASGKPRLRPTLFLGVGGQGCSTLRHLKQRLAQKFEHSGEMPIFGFLQVDTDRQGIRLGLQDGMGLPLTPDETVLASLGKPDHYRAKSKNILKWLDRRWLFGIPRSLATEGIRPLGYLAFIDHGLEIKEKLHAVLATITGQEAQETVEEQGYEVDLQGPRIYLVASISGATGSGMVVGLAYLVQQVLLELKMSGDDLCGILLHSSSPKSDQKDLACVNATATLEELRHFSSPLHAYPGDPAQGLAAFAPQVAPLETCYLVHLGDSMSLEEVETATATVAEYLFLDAATEAGANLDQFRSATRLESPNEEEPFKLRGFGLLRVHMPRNELIHQATDLFCRNLVSKWPGEQTEAQKARIEKEAEDRARSLGIKEEDLIAKFHLISEEALGEDLEVLFTKFITKAAPEPGKPISSSEPLGSSLKAIDGLLGHGEDSSKEANKTATAFEKALAAKAHELSRELATSLLDWLHRIVEDPAQRLKAAENAAQRLSQFLLNAVENVQLQAAQLKQYRDGLRHRIDSGPQAAKLSGIRRLGSVRRQSQGGGTANSRAMDYCWARIGEIALEKTRDVLSALHYEIGNFSQDLIHSRHKLAHFVSMFDQDRSSKLSGHKGSGNSTLIELFPGQAKGINEAAEKLIESLPSDLARNLEDQFQAEVLDKDSGLWGMLSGDQDSVQTRSTGQATSSLAFWDLVSKHSDIALKYKDKLIGRVRPIVAAVIKDLDPAQMFLESKSTPRLFEDALHKCITAAQPKPAIADAWQHLLLALPGSAAGKELHEMIKTCLPDVPTTAIHSDDDILLCLEAAHLSVDDVLTALTGQEPHYARLAQRVMTRIDIPWPVLSLEET